MAFATDIGALVERFDGVGAAEIRSPNRLINQITTRQDVGNAERVHESVIDYDSVVATAGTDRNAQHADWAASSEYTARVVTWSTNRSQRASVRLRRLDVLQSPVLSVETGRRDTNNKIMSGETNDLIAYLGSLTTHAAGAQANKAANGNAGSILNQGEIGGFTSGTNAAYINRTTGEAVNAGATGTGEGNSIEERIVKAIRGMQVIFMRSRIMGDGEDISGGGIGTPWMLSAPEVTRALADYLEDKGLGLQSIDPPVIRDGTVAMEPSDMAEGRMDAVGKYRGFILLSSADMPRPAADADGWPIYFGTSRAVQVAGLTPVVQVLTPETNQTSPNYEVREHYDYGRQLVNSGLLVKMEVNSGA